MKHAFAVPAYGDSEYLDSCLNSLMNQTAASDIIICTSTPSTYIETLGAKYGIPVYVRNGEPGIANDWNFAYEKADAELVTIAHQDDIYRRNYTEVLLKNKEKYPDMSVFMSSAAIIKNGRLMKDGRNEIVKKLLRLPLIFPELNNSTGIKMAVISMGNPVICPSCTYDKKLCGKDLFDPKYKFVLDWDALYRLAEKDGRWICSETPLMMYRVHGDAATGKAIKDKTREREESVMFDRMLPEKISEAVKRIYKKSYEAYKNS